MANKKIKIDDSQSTNIGMWYSKTMRRYQSKVFNVNSLRDYKGNIRFTLFKNKFKSNADDGRPQMIIRIVGAKSERLTDFEFYEIKHPTDDGTEYITVEQALQFARQGAEGIRGGYGEFDVWCHQDLEGIGRTLTDLVNEKLAETKENI